MAISLRMKTHHLLRFVCLNLLFLPFIARADMANDPRPFMLRGMEKYAWPEYSDTLCAFGNEMLPVFGSGSPTQEQAIVVAGEFGKGRFVAFGHRAFLDGSLATKGDDMMFVKSALWWASTHKVGKNKAGFVGVLNLPPSVTFYLQGEGFSAQDTTLKDLEGLEAVIGDISDLKDNEVEQLRKIAENGGGLVIAGDATQWAKIHPDKNVALDYPPNKLMAPRGCFWNGDPVKLPAEPTKPVACTDLLHGRDALNLAIKIADGREKPSAEQRRLVSFILNRAFYYCPPDDQALLPDLHVAMHVASLRAFPTVDTPINIGDVLPRLFVADMCKQFLTKPVGAVRIHPSALNFPGYTDAETGSDKPVVSFDPTIERWQGTGLYAPPGEIVRVEVPTNFVDLKIKLRIGCHSDKIWEVDDWTRYPELCREFPVTGYSNEIGIAFGGPIYAIFPPGCVPASTNPPVPVQMRFSGALRQPYFIRGRTTSDYWNDTGSRGPAPWSEFGSLDIVFNIPSKLVRGATKVNQFMMAWDNIIETMRTFTSATNRNYAERIVADQQPLGGKMHAGYPVVITMNRAADVMNLRGLADGSNFDILGLLGQNDIPPAIAFDGGKEILGQLAALYAVETFIGKKIEDYLPDFGGEKRTNRLAAYFSQGSKFETMKADPYYGDVMLSQLVRGIGWTSFQKMFATATAMSAKVQPLNDDTRRDVFLVLLSKSANKNLAPFFKKWGLTFGEGATTKVASLPDYKCEELDHIPAAPTAPVEAPKKDEPKKPAKPDEENKAGPSVKAE